jgi:hypothetical protein
MPVFSIQTNHCSYRIEMTHDAASIVFHSARTRKSGIHSAS